MCYLFMKKNGGNAEFVISLTVTVFVFSQTGIVRLDPVNTEGMIDIYSFQVALAADYDINRALNFFYSF